MTNVNPIWKTLLLAAVFVIGVLFALPNLFGSDPAVQISGRNNDLTQTDISSFNATLEKSGFENVEIREEQGRYLALFANEDDQIRARDALAKSLDPNRYITALNLVDASPEWLRNIAAPMYLGLDLRGGVHFLMEVDMQAALTSAEERFVPDWKREVRAKKYRGISIQYKDEELTARFKDVAKRDEMLSIFREDGIDLDFATSEDAEYSYIVANLTEEAAQEEQRSALQQNIVTLRNRINELGVSEPVIQQQGVDRIVVQLPGVQDTGRAKAILGATATLEYRWVSTAAVAKA
jgi:preprotein translocase subunit SecD